jgi:hypothetical protein
MLKNSPHLPQLFRHLTFCSLPLLATKMPATKKAVAPISALAKFRTALLVEVLAVKLGK